MPETTIRRREEVTRHVVSEALRKGGVCWSKAKHIAEELGWGRQAARVVAQALLKVPGWFPGGRLEVEPHAHCRARTYKFTVTTTNREALEEWLWGATRTRPSPVALLWG